MQINEIYIIIIIPGNNNLTPKTEGGKIFTCLYALAGIPLLLLYMTNIGNLLAQSFIEFYLSLDR